MSETVSIRRARKDDQEALAVFWLRFLEEQSSLDPRFGIAEDALERWMNDFSHWLHDERRRILVAERAEAVVGFVTAQRWVPPPIYAETVEVYIDELFVVPEMRGKGVGERLVDAVRRWAETLRADRLRMGVLAANGAGRRFWERQQGRPFSVTYTIELEKGREIGNESKKGRLGF